MSTVFKTLLNDDVVSTRTLLHESIPLTGTIVSGSTYADSNIKNYSHGRFQSVYDYPYLSSSANHVFDITVGYSPNSALSSSASTDNSKKIQIYKQLSQMLVGHDTNGGILDFDQDGDILAGGTKVKEAIFLSFSRLLTKDEIQKGNMNFLVGDSLYSSPQLTSKSVLDYGAANEFRVNSPSGEYGLLYTSSVNITTSSAVGLLYYQAGIMVLTASLFAGSANAFHFDFVAGQPQTVDQAFTGSSIQNICNTVRRRYLNLSFVNTVELNSTIYFCRANHNEFNYSSNPTYLSGSKIVTKNSTIDSPTTYVTTIGLYSADSELLAVAKLSEPLKKDPTNELVMRVRLDY